MSTQSTQTTRALFSVSDKTGLAKFAEELGLFGIQILSTGGTAKELRKAGIPVTDVSEYTGAPELFDGRLKTLHPKVHGGLLQRRRNKKDIEEAAANNIPQIDFVVVNLYPFEQTVAKPDTTFDDAIENIDIGGPSMLRSAAKNFADVTVVIDPADYPRVIGCMRENDGKTTLALRRELALKVFERTSRYDAAILTYLESQDTDNASVMPSTLRLCLPKAQDLRYGENPHQKSALYGDFWKYYSQHGGKELSYTNILDIASASTLIDDLGDDSIAILKHTTPCGVAIDGTSPVEAWNLAFATDKDSPFGGVIVLPWKTEVDTDLVDVLKDIFVEIVIASSFTPGALAALQRRKNLRIIQRTGIPPFDLDLKSIPGGMLVQERDVLREAWSDFKVVTKRLPTEEEKFAMMFAWKVVKNAKSNAMVYAKYQGGTYRTLCIGAGQTSRVDASKIAIWKSEQADLSLVGSVLASEAFIPFADGAEAAFKAGATAIIQTGGSIRDKEVIAAADAAGAAMVMTGYRHFRHG